jgi:aspartyl-tRNA synthetase
LLLKIKKNDTMKTIFTLLFVSVFIFTSCNSATNSGKNKEDKSSKTVAAGAVYVDDLLSDPGKYLEKKVSIKGLVVHTCKHSGKKMFLAGTDKNKFVKVIAGPSISRFDQSLEGETVVATGTLTLLDESQEKHGTGEHLMKTGEESGSDSTAGCKTETKIKNYQMVCDGFEVVNK